MRRADIEVPNLAVDGNSRARSACYPRGSFYPLSDGPSTRYRRITRTLFRDCSTRRSHSKATLYPCTLKDDFHSPRGDLRAPPLLFRRRPPQSNCPPDNVPRSVPELAVRTPVHQGWYPNDGSSTADAAPSTPPTYSVHDIPRPNIRIQ